MISNLSTYWQLLSVICQNGTDFPWIGRINILKMNVLSCLLYLYHALLICLPQPFFVSLNIMIVNFIWAQKKPTKACTMLSRAKLDGGLAVLDPLSYYVASMATRIIDWFHHQNVKLLFLLENALNKTPLSWIPAFTWPKTSLMTVPFVACTSIFVCRTDITLQNFLHQTVLSPLFWAIQLFLCPLWFPLSLLRLVTCHQFYTT